MTTEEQYLQNRATAEVMRYFFRRIARTLRAFHPDWNFSLEVGPSVLPGLFTTDNKPAAVADFERLVRVLREFDPTLKVRIEGHYTVTPVAGMTMPLYFPQGAPGPSNPPPPPPPDYVPNPNKLPPTCPICGPKIYIA
jgi:hypothetical protein